MSFTRSTPAMVRFGELYELLLSNKEARADLAKAPNIASWIRRSVCRAYGFKGEEQRKEEMLKAWAQKEGLKTPDESAEEKAERDGARD